MIRLSKPELGELIRFAGYREITNALSQRGWSINDIRDDPAKMKAVSDAIAKRAVTDRDEHEIFGALFVFADFYSPDSGICFELKPGFNNTRDTISSLDDLKKFREGDSDVDFAIMTGDQLRIFQLKRYRGELNTEVLLDFIKTKLRHYGNNLGDTNLLIITQSDIPDISGVDFTVMHQELTSMGLTFPGAILVSYNAMNRNMIINQVYPNLTTSHIPIVLPSNQPWVTSSTMFN